MMREVDQRSLDGARERVCERIEVLREDAVDLLEALVRIDSTNPSFAGIDRAEVIGGETRCNELLRERYERAGLEAHWVAPDPERKNLVGVRRGAGSGRSLILNGHVDTVPPVEPGAWITGSPWRPEVRDGRLYGLGSTDMKSSQTAMWLVAQALEDTGTRLAGELQLHSVVGEEMMEHELGTTACVRAGFRADAAVVTEPTSFPSPLTVSPVAPGNWYLRIVVEGKSTHCGNRPLAVRPGGPGDAIGVNALEKGVKIVTALQELEAHWGMTKSHPYFSPGFFTLLPGVFYADPGLPIPFYFANRAEILYSIWYPPQQDAREVADEIEEYVLAACRLDSWLREHPPRFEWLSNWPPMDTGWEHPIVQAMVRGHELASGRRVPPPSPQHPVNFGAASDGSFLEDVGIPTVVFGPGDLRLAHCKDESVALAEMIAAAKSLAACVLVWCGVAA